MRNKLNSRITLKEWKHYIVNKEQQKFLFLTTNRGDGLSYVHNGSADKFAFERPVPFALQLLKLNRAPGARRRRTRGVTVKEISDAPFQKPYQPFVTETLFSYGIAVGGKKKFDYTVELIFTEMKSCRVDWNTIVLTPIANLKGTDRHLK